MPSTLREPPWDFSPTPPRVHLSDGAGAAPPTVSIRGGSDDESPSHLNTSRQADTPKDSLGDFSKIFEHLRVLHGAPLPPIGPADSEQADLSTSDDALLSTPATTPPTHPTESSECAGELSHTIDAVDSFSLAQDSHAGAQEAFAGLNKKQRAKARKRAAKARLEDEQKRQEYEENERVRAHLLAGLAQAPLVSSPQKAGSDPVFPRPSSSLASNIGIKLRAPPAIAPEPLVLRQDDPPDQTQRPVNAKTIPLPTSAVTTSLEAHSAGRGSSGEAQSLLLRTRSSAMMEECTTEVLRKGVDPSLVRPYNEVARYNGVDISPVLYLKGGYDNVKSSTAANPDRMAPEAPQLYTASSTPVRNPQINRCLPPVHTPLARFKTPYAQGPIPKFTPASRNLSLVPSSVRAVTIPHQELKTITRTQSDKNFDFLKKLVERFPEDKGWLVAPMRLSTSEKISPRGIHVLVDASNILNNQRVRAGQLSFDCVALLLERRRPVAKRVYVGSIRSGASHSSHERFQELAGAVGYETHLLEQVLKPKEPPKSRQFFKDVAQFGWTKAQAMHAPDSDSDPETGAADVGSPSKLPPPTPKWVEQGVDEVLHLKMCQSIVDCAGCPSTMVLATGDGNEAEFSDGFFANVERALKAGWTVELVSWKQQMSASYRKSRFRDKWGERFKIIYLDDWLEFLEG